MIVAMKFIVYRTLILILLILINFCINCSNQKNIKIEILSDVYVLEKPYSLEKGNNKIIHTFRKGEIIYVDNYEYTKSYLVFKPKIEGNSSGYIIYDPLQMKIDLEQLK